MARSGLPAWIALALLIIVFALIITEVVHRTLIAFMGAAAVLFLLALEHLRRCTSSCSGWTTGLWRCWG